MSPSLSSSSSSLSSGDGSSNNVANAQTMPGLAPTPPQCVRRGFPDGVSLGQPPPGKGLLVVEKWICSPIVTNTPPNILKQNNNPGYAIPTDFSIAVTGSIVLDAGTGAERVVTRHVFPGAASLILNPGSYSVSETLPSRRDLNTVPNAPSRPNNGYVPAAYEGNCNGAIDARQPPEQRIKYCTIRNHPVPSQVLLARPPPDKAVVLFQKVIVNDNGRTATWRDFNIIVNNNDRPISPATPFTFMWGPHTTITQLFYLISPGTYRVSETSPTGYSSPIYLKDPITGSNIMAGQIRFITSISNDK